MSVSELSTSAQNYLKAIWSLQEWSDQPVGTSALAARVGVGVSTVSDALRKLDAQGLVEHSRYGAVELTPQGRGYAVAMVRRHRLLETFLVQTLGLGWDAVHDEAETLEHAVSDRLIDRIDEHLGHPTRDPHGDPIPAPDGAIPALDAVALSVVEPGARVRVERIADTDPALLQFLAAQGIGVGTDLVTSAGTPFSDSVQVAIVPDGPPIALGPSAAGSVWVAPVD